MHQKAANELLRTHACAKELQVTRATLLRYRNAMAGIVRSMGVNGSSVEDVVHDAFETACRKAEADRPDPRDEKRFGGWLCTLAKFAAMSTRNDTARCREVSSPTEDLEGVPESQRSYIGHYDDKVAAAVVFASLSADDRALLHQHFYEEKTIQELAAERGVPWTTMRSRIESVIHRARSIMFDDKSNRRRTGAVVLAAVGVCFREVYAYAQSLWFTSKRTALPLGVGFTTGAVVAALVVPNGPAVFAPAANRIVMTGTTAAMRASFGAGDRTRVPTIAISISAAPAAATPATPSRGPAVRSGDQRRDRASTEWALSNDQSNRKGTSNTRQKR